MTSKTTHLGTPRVITDALGQVKARRDFMPFGEELYNVGGERSGAMKYGAADSVRQKYTSYHRDEETGLDFAEARMYENRHARFTAVDPLLASGKSSNPQTFNRYVYVMNNPLLFTDPNGLQAGQWYSPVTADGSTDTSRTYKYILSGDSTAGYSSVTERNKSGDLIGSFAGGESTGAENRGSDFVLRFNSNGPREPQQMVDVNTGRKSYETLSDFDRDGFEIIKSDAYLSNHPATGAVVNAIEPIDVALFLSPIKTARSPISFFRGTTYYDAVETVSSQSINMERLAARQVGANLELGEGLYLTRSSKTAEIFAELQGLKGRQGGPAILEVTTSRFRFWQMQRRFNIVDNVPVEGLPGHTQTLIPYEAVPLINRHANFRFY